MGDTVNIQVTNTKNPKEHVYAIIDIKYEKLIKRHVWRLYNGRPVTNKRVGSCYKIVCMGSIILNTTETVLYIDGNPLNNTETNLLDTSKKVCTLCGEAKPRTTDFFNINYTTKDGLSYYCKLCIHLKNKSLNTNKVDTKIKELQEKLKTTTLLKEDVVAAIQECKDAKKLLTKTRRRKYNVEYNKERYNSKKTKARLLSNLAKQFSILITPDKCEDCGISNVPLQMHHTDYDDPLNVIFVCKDCHGIRHRSFSNSEIS